jgi:oxygen-independent coproporphyrinogen-3 oxidase
MPGFESRHNLKYWLGESVAALGPTGTGYFSLSKTAAYRYKWKPGRAEIEEEILGASELELEKLYLRLRLSVPFVARELMNHPNFENLLEKWGQRGLVERLDGAWRMKPSSWVILDSLMDEVFSMTEGQQF